ncbi:MAG TPA: hypothetical protein VMT47_16605 [Polyangia bacterium]|nr:hypothetical protein [Polyangia bacterium]
MAARSDGPPGELPMLRPPLWFLADREAFVRRFALRTLLRPSPFRRGPLPRALKR